MKRILFFLKKTEEFFLATCFAVMGIVLAAQIVSRYLFNYPLSWAEELARYLQIWITFLGLGYGIRNGSHIALSLIRQRMPKVVGFAVGVFFNTLAAIACLLTAIVSPQFLAQQDKLASTLPISLQVVYVAIPVGLFIGSIYLVAFIFLDIRNYIQGEEQPC